MSLLDWAILGVGVAGYVVAFRKIAYAMAFDVSKPDWADVVSSLLFAALAAFFWPLFAIGLLLKVAVRAKDPAQFMARIGSEPKQARVKRLEREAREREFHVKRLERELGIR